MAMSWTKRLERAKRNGYFTPSDNTLAESWNTCAVGEGLNAKLPGREGVVGKNNGTIIYEFYPALDHEGVKFLQAVEKNQVVRATKIYAKIQGLMKTIFETRSTF